MTTKKICDVCGKEIPDTAIMEHNEATKHSCGGFWYGAITLECSFDLCSVCGLEVAKYIERLQSDLKGM